MSKICVICLRKIRIWNSDTCVTGIINAPEAMRDSGWDEHWAHNKCMKEWEKRGVE
jgi:hypothetical protein